MPSSAAVAVLVLGAVLLLVAVLGGNFAIFGAEVRERVGTGPRTAAAIGGVLLLLVGLGLAEEGGAGDAERAASVRRHILASLAAATTAQSTGDVSRLADHFAPAAQRAIADQAREERVGLSRMGRSVSLEVAGMDVEQLDFGRGGRTATSRVRVSYRIRVSAREGCREGYTAPVPLTIDLQRDGPGWLVYHYGQGSEAQTVFDGVELRPC